MDSITQLTLGAALGESMLGKKIGIRAAVWGAFLGTFPDLDVLVNPMLDNVAELRFHRSLTHSILFCFIASPLFGYLIHYFHQDWDIGRRRWAKTAFLIFSTHIFLDVITTYGTQIFYPFSDWPVTTDTLFIIDPVYTLTLLFGLLPALFFARNSKRRKYVNRAGLLVSTMYIVWAFGIKAHVHSVYDASFEHQYGFYDKLKTTPNGPTTFLWTGYVIRQDTVYQSVYSIFDEDTHLQFRAIPRNTYLIDEYASDRGVKTLLWFSRDFYTVKQIDNSLVFYDLRFGRSDLWLTDSPNTEYIWQNYIMFDDKGNAISFEQAEPTFNTRSSILSRFIDRIKGE